MTVIYLVRHAEPDHSWEEDSTRPLTEEGKADARKVADFFREVHVDHFRSSPYERSVDTIKPSANEKSLDISMDLRLREREKGLHGNSQDMFRRRWADFSFHEEGGESLEMVQKRNMEVMEEIQRSQEGRTVVLGTHGTAMSTILHHYDPTFGLKDFLRIINFMPYVVKLTFHGETLTGKEELLYLEKKYTGK